MDRSELDGLSPLYAVATCLDQIKAIGPMSMHRDIGPDGAVQIAIDYADYARARIDYLLGAQKKSLAEIEAMNEADSPRPSAKR